jgi:phosphoglycerate dehydrogenase-like enzyme
MSMARVALLDDYQDVALQMADWKSLPADTDVHVFHDHLHDDDALVARLHDFDMVMAMRERTPFTRSRFERLPNLKLLITAGMRNAAINLQAASDCGVMVCGTEGLPYPTAELTWALILGIMRQIPQEDHATRNGQWQVSLGLGLQGKTLGMLGLGRLGSQVATVGNAFNMKVIAWSHNLTADRAQEYGATLVSQDELLVQSDILTIHLVLGDRSRGLLGAGELAKMKSTAYLVNTSRGPIVDEAALIHALEQGIIAGAALDVFDIEPLPLDHPFRRMANVVVSPHIGYVTEETYRVFYGDALDNIQAFLAGQPIRVLNPS